MREVLGPHFPLFLYVVRFTIITENHSQPRNQQQQGAIQGKPIDKESNAHQLKPTT
eukprot:m.39067 g.39067  ORF g.39067 m.39067 type:complete len:56 (-) comp6836_c0_seq2:70-237(-)